MCRDLEPSRAQSRSVRALREICQFGLDSAQGDYIEFDQSLRYFA